MTPNLPPLPTPTPYIFPIITQRSDKETAVTLPPANQTDTKSTPSTDVDPVAPGGTPLQKMHATASDSSSALPTISHSEEEKNKNLQRQESMKNLGRVEIQIGKLQRDLKKANYQKNPDKCRELKESLRQLKKKKSELTAEIRSEASANSSSKQVSREDSADNSSEASANSSSKQVSSEDSTDSSTSEESIGEQLRNVKEEIKSCKESLESAERKDNEKQVSRLQKKLTDLRRRREHLESQLSSSQPDRASVRHSHELDLQDYEAVERDLEECKVSLRRAHKLGEEEEVRSLMDEIQKLESEREELRSRIEAADGRNASTSGSDSPSPVSADRITDVKYQLKGLLAKIAELDHLLAELNSQGAMKESIQKRLAERQALEEEAGYLQILLRDVEGQENADAVEETVASTSTAPSPPARKASMSRMIRAAATKRRKLSMSATQPAIVTVDGATPLKTLHDKTRNSTLLMSGDLKKHFNVFALQEIDKLELQLETLANDIDLLYESRRQKIEAGSPPGSRQARDQRHREIQSLDKRILKGNIRLGKLIEERDKLEAKVIAPAKVLTPKEQTEHYKTFVESFKSEKTRELEKKHVQLLAELEHQSACSCGTFGLQLLGGLVANAASFFIGNSIARAIVPSFAGALVSVPVSACLHVMFAGPLLKQILDRMWNAPALAEFNNYFKLLGASWGDWARGEENVKKYISKDPDKTEKLTIAERRAEQRPFKDLLADRYKTEEAGYYAYSINYGLKALVAGGLATTMSSVSDTYRWSEWAAHSVMGWISGAEYVLAMQKSRSLISGAKQIVLPDRATSAAEAEALQSLLDDLQKALEKARHRKEKDPADMTERNLLKAIRQTGKSLQAARTRSGFMGTFRHEVKAQFANKEATADTLSESFGRTISLIPTAVLAEFLQPWRASGNFWLVSGAHALQGLLLIMPPGFTARPLYSGFLRALMQAGMNGRDSSAAARAQPSSSGRVPAEEDQDEESIIVEVSSDSDDEGWHGNPRESDQDFW